MIYENYFLGEVPRMQSRILPAGAFDLALNVNFEDGAIRGWRCPEKLCPTDFTPATIISTQGCCAYEESFSWVRYVNSGCDYYVRNYRGKLEWSRSACGDWSGFTMDCPSSAPSVSVEGESCDPVGVSYLYAYVHELGHVSAPSKPSKAVLGGSGRAEITGIAPSKDDGVVAIQVYRLEETPQAGSGAAIIDNDYFLVGEIDAGETSFTDRSGIGCAGEPLHTAGAFPPPSNIQGLQALSNGALVAFSGRQLYFSDPTDLEPNPHAWSGDWDIELPDKIEAILVVGDTLYVATDGHPYAVTPRGAGQDFVYNYQQMPQRLPITSPESLHQTGSGAGYVASSGLVHFNASGAAVITDKYFTRSNWRKAGIYNAIEVAGRTVLVGSTTSYIMWAGNPPRAPSEFTPLSQIDLIGKPKTMMVDEDEDLIYAGDDGVYLFSFETTEQGDECCPYEVLSKVYVHPANMNYAGGKVGTAGSVEFAFYKVDCGDVREMEKRQVICDKFRLPAKYSGTDYQYRLKGCDPVYSIHIAETYTELAAR